VRDLEQGGGALPLADLAASFQAVVSDVLVERSLRCVEDEGLDTLVLVGGVAANRRLRQRLQEQASARGIDWRVAPLAYCTDNAAMIGRAALQRLSAGQTSSIRLGVSARFPLEEADKLYGDEPCF
jgi:N6-L-threonylcarbamoyladenine synthase